MVQKNCGGWQFYVIILVLITQKNQMFFRAVKFLWFLFFGLLITGFFVMGAKSVEAATIYVNYSTGNDTTGNGSSDTPYKTFHKGYTMASSGDTLNLTGTFNWTNADETGDAQTTGYTLSKNLTLQGQSASQTIVQAASSYASGDRSVFTVTAGYTVTMNDLTIRYGYNRTGSDGGGINNNGTLTVNRANIAYNYVWYYPSWGGYGGGIRNAGTLTINDSTVNNNFAQSQGGGIVNAYTAGNTNVAYITNTTIAFNSTADVVATVGGAGVFVRSGTVYITNCTIAYNVAPDGTGDSTGLDVEDPSAAAYVKNSIIAHNKVTVSGVDHDVNYASGNFFDMTAYGHIYDNGGNIFGKVSPSYNGVSLAATTWYDLYGNDAGDNVYTLYGSATTGSLNLDTALADNGTLYGNQTLAITNGSSISVNRGLATANGAVSIPSNDARGAARNSTTDIGAYEYDGGLTVSEPTTQASSTTFSSVAYNQMTISWTNGDGAKRVVFVKQGDSGTATPVDLTTYTANTTFGSGTQIGTSGWYAVYNDTGTSVTVTGLAESTSYIVQVFEYNGTTGYQDYLITTGTDNPKAQATVALVAPTSQASSVSFSSVAYNQMTVGWNNGNGSKRAVFIKAASSGTTTPANDTTYTASTTFGSGTQIDSSGWYCIYNGTGSSVTVTGLSASTSYMVQVFEYNGAAGVEKYFTDTASDNPKAQATSAAPSEVTIGTGTSTTGIAEASPINIWYRSLHGQSVYTKTELNAAGISGSTEISKIGFYVAGAPIRALPNFIIRMKHTSDADVTNWQSATGMTTVYSTSSYTPTAGGFDSITLTTPFTWNGTDNLVIDTAFSIVDYDQSGTVRYYSSSNGYRYARSDSSDQTNIFTGGSTSSSKPQIKLTFSSATTTTYTLSYAAGAHGSLTGSTSQTVNSGASGSAVTAVADTGYHFTSWSDGSTSNPRTDSNVAANVSVTASFVINTYTLTYAAGAHGSLTGTTTQTVNYGASGTAVTAVADEGYAFVSWSDDSTDNPRTDSNVTANASLTASFSADTVYVNSSTGNDTTGDGSSGAPYKTFHKGYTMTPAGDTLDLTGTFDWTNSAETGDTATNGYTISKSITIAGHGADTTIIQAASADNTADRRVLTIGANTTTTIQNLAIRFGKTTTSSADGGGIKNSGVLTLNDCEIYNNRALGSYGGGATNYHKMTVNRSTVYNNVANYMGGGLLNSYYVSADGYLNITNSTIAYNQVTAVTAYTEGGGVHYRKGSGTITNSTIAYNTACGASGVGMDDPAGTVTLKNNIIAKNIRLNHSYCGNGNGAMDFDFRQTGYGNVSDNGNNIVGYSYRYTWSGANDWIGATTWSGNLNWDRETFTLYGSATTGELNLDDALALNSNSYKTQTLALLTDSIAINHGATGSNGSVSVPTSDQRSVARSGATDIGAFEYSAPPADTTAPTISNIEATSTESAVTISWSTSEEANAQVKYDPNTNLSTHSLIYDNNTKTIGHEITLSNLVSCTKYYYAVISQDDAGNTATSETGNFMTLGCAGSATVSTVSELSFVPTETNDAELDGTSEATDDDYTVSQTSGGLTFNLTIPRTFTETPASLQLKSLGASAALNSLSRPSGQTEAGSAVFDIKALADPASTVSSFNSAATVSLTYSDSDVAGLDESTLQIYRNDGNSWYALSSCSVNTASNAVTCSTTSFSTFALFGEALATTSQSSGTTSATGSGYVAPAAVGSGSRSAEVMMGGEANIGLVGTNGVNVLGYIDSKVNFKTLVSGSKSTEEHNWQVAEVDLTAKTVTLIFQSEPVRIQLELGETKSVDLDQDKTVDVAVTFTDLIVNRVEVTIKNIVTVKEEKITTPTVATHNFVFTRDLKTGMLGEDVRELQKYLNNNGFILAKSGPGSPGQETNKFGALTRGAVIRFQKANKIWPTIGYFGPVTRGVINKE